MNNEIRAAYEAAMQGKGECTEQGLEAFALGAEWMSKKMCSEVSNRDIESTGGAGWFGLDAVQMS